MNPKERVFIEIGIEEADYFDFKNSSDIRGNIIGKLIDELIRKESIIEAIRK